MPLKKGLPETMESVSIDGATLRWIPDLRGPLRPERRDWGSSEMREAYKFSLFIPKSPKVLSGI